MGDVNSIGKDTGVFFLGSREEEREATVPIHDSLQASTCPWATVDGSCGAFASIL